VTPSRFRFAVVGCGSIGSRHARNLRALGAPELAFCDSDRIRAVELATALDAQVATDDLDALLVEYRPTAVLVCTPPGSHLGVAMRALEAGAHVLCEEPLAPTLDGVDELLELAERQQRFVMMGMCHRFHGGLRRFQQRIAGGTVGRLLGAQMWTGHYLPDRHPPADYRTGSSAEGRLEDGVLLDGIHALDTLRWALGEPVDVLGMLGKVSDLDIDAEDLAAAILRLENGAIVEVHVDHVQRHAVSRCEVIGSEGNLVWDSGSQTIRWRRADDVGWSEERILVDTNEMYVAELCEFIDCVASGRRPALDATEGRATLALAAAVRTAAESRRLISLPTPPRPFVAADS
jgi:predicted dehydrogenase